MNKTHKKALGFAGLGLVAAFTVAAAALPAPTATAVSSITDVIQVYVPHNEPEITVTTGSESEGTDPNYSFKIIYENLKNLKVELVNRDEGGGLILSQEVFNTDLHWEVGEKQIDLNLANYGGYGDFTFIITGLGEGNVPVERILTYAYKAAPDEKEPGEGENVDVDVDVPDERITHITVNVYDDSGNIVKVIEIPDPKNKETMDLSDLPDGTYKLEIISKNKYNEVLDTEWRTVVIDRDGQNADIETPIEDVGQEIDHVVITVTDEGGNVVAQVTVDHPNPGSTITVPLPDNLPAGKYTVTTDYYDQNNTIIKTTTYTFTKSDANGNVDIDVNTEVNTVTSIETVIYNENGDLVRTIVTDRATGVAKVYDKDGKLLFTIPNGLQDNKLLISMDGLDSGEYTAVITYRNKYGHQVGNSKTIKIKYNAGEAIIVPDTGSFFQNLNISREDYLITGLAVFMIIGVVAFGVIIKKRRNRR